MPRFIKPYLRPFGKSSLIVALMGVFIFTASPLQAQRGGLSIIRDTEIEDSFKTWAEPLLKQANLGRESVNIILVQSNDVNAFVAGGANVFFYTGLLEKTDGPGEVIGVLAHELGHIAGGHLIGSRAAMERASYQSILGIALGIGAAIATGDGAAAQAVISGGNSMAQRGFLAHSRVNESAADQAGFKYMSGAGINPSGLASFFEKLRGQEYIPESQQVEYVRTHPLTRNRIDAIETLIGQTDLKDKAYPPAWVEEHARMKAKLIGFINPGRVAWEYDDRDNSIAARYARTIALYRNNEIDKALAGIDDLIASEPKNPYFHELKGQMLVDFSRIDAAIGPYEQAVKLLPDAGLIRIALAHALIESGNSSARLEEAAKHLQRALKTEEHSSRAHRLLATAYGRLGESGLTKLHLAEEAVLQRRLPYAQQQAEGALKELRNGSTEWRQARDVLAQIENLKTAVN